MGIRWPLDTMSGIWGHIRGQGNKQWSPIEVDGNNNLHVVIGGAGPEAFYVVSGVLHNGASASAPGNIVECRGLATLGLQITGTFVATLHLEGTIDGLNWVAVQGSNPSIGVVADTVTETGLRMVPVAGLHSFRARLVWTSGMSISVHVYGVGFPLAHLLPVL